MKNKINICRIMKIILLGVCIQLLISQNVAAQNTSKIDWLQGYVSATGRGYAKKTGTPIDREKAITAAKVIAQRELLETIKGVKIDYQKAISDLMTEVTETSVRVQGVLRNAVQVGEPNIKEDGEYLIAAVEMRVCLFENRAECKSEESLVNALPKSSVENYCKNTSCSFIPNITSTRQILSKVTYDTNQPLTIAIVNLKGFPFNTTFHDFMIGFKTKNGKNCSIYTPDKVDPIIRRDRGTAEIFIHASDARRKYGANIVAINALSIDKSNYIIIDEKDAYLLNLLNERENQIIFNQAKIGVAAQD